MEKQPSIFYETNNDRVIVMTQDMQKLLNKFIILNELEGKQSGAYEVADMANWTNEMHISTAIQFATKYLEESLLNKKK